MSKFIKISESNKSKKVERAEKTMNFEFEQPKVVNSFEINRWNLKVTERRRIKRMEQVFNPILNSFWINSEKNIWYNTATITLNFVNKWKKEWKPISYDKLSQELNHPNIKKKKAKLIKEVQSQFKTIITTHYEAFGLNLTWISKEAWAQFAEDYIFNLYIIKWLQGAVTEYNIKAWLSADYDIMLPTKKQDVNESIDLLIRKKDKTPFTNEALKKTWKNNNFIWIQIKTINFFKGINGTTKYAMQTNLNKQASSKYNVFFLYKDWVNFDDVKVWYWSWLIKWITWWNLKNLFY